MKIIELDTVDSTNNYAAKLLNEDNSINNTFIFAKEQTKGRGTGINSWFSEYNKNILLSFIFEPKINVENCFSITDSTSLSICEYLQNRNVFAQIKYPNDICYQNKKICGILIENTILGSIVNKSIIGIGLNINQTEFPKHLINPISLKNITNKEYNIKEELKLLCEILVKRLVIHSKS